MPSIATANDTWTNITAGPQRKRSYKPDKIVTVQPQSADEIAAILTDTRRFPTPVRPVGSGSSTTRANATAAGTLVDMTGLNRVLAVTSDTVTVQAGVRLRELAEHLAADGMELTGGCAEPNRTVGGAISSGTLSGALPGVDGQLASSVLSLSLINGRGRRVEISTRLPDLLMLTRMSYGLLGIVYAVTLSIRPISPYTVRNSKFDFEELARLVPMLIESPAAVHATLMPYRDRVHLAQRYTTVDQGRSAVLPWKLRDWANNSALPCMVRSVSRVMPIRQLRDPLIDSVSEATSVLVNNRFADSGSNAAEQSGRFRRLVLDEDVVSCVWLFPASRFAAAIRTWQKFCVRHYRVSRFRCDLPAEVWRIDADQGALLSPSFDGPVFALNMRSTLHDGWDDFLMEYAEFAAHFRGIPVFNQTGCFKPGYARRVYGERLQRFKSMRERLDPENRLLNQYFAEHIG